MVHVWYTVYHSRSSSTTNKPAAMLCTRLLRRSSAYYRHSWTVRCADMLTNSAITRQSRSIITIKKFYRDKDTGEAKKAKATPLADENASASSSQTAEATAANTAKPVRLAKRIALAGVCSRREAEKLIQGHEVMVNGKIVTDLATNIDPENDLVAVRGRQLAKSTRRKMWMANKLPGELVTANDPQNRPTIFDRLRVMGLVQHMMPVGRLDFNTEGLLLFTNDGEYARELEHPKNEITRVYRVLVRGSVTPSKLDELRRGPVVDGIKYRSIQAFVQSTDKKDSWLQVRIAEGKNREVRKALAHVRLVVKRLIRVQYGPYRLADLPTGAVLEVRPKSLISKTPSTSRPRDSRAKKQAPRAQRDAVSKQERDADIASDSDSE